MKPHLRFPAPARTGNHSTALNGSESIVLGSIIENAGQNLPPHLARLLDYAPESFDDQRHASTAVAIRKLLRDRKPVHQVSVMQAVSFNDSSAFVLELIQSALDISIAEQEAIELCKAFQQRETIQIIGEAHQELQDHPEAVHAVARNLIQTLEGIAGESSGMESQIEARTFDAAKIIEQPAPRFTLAGVPVSTPGNLTSVSAPPKAAKSSFIAAGMSSVMTHSEMADCLGWRSSNHAGGALIHLDTEQSEYDHHALIQRTLLRAQSPAPTWLRSSFITGFSVNQCREAIRHALKSGADKCGSIHSMILDGIGDFVCDVNDPAECNDFVAELHALAIKFHCPILGVIHFNPGTEKTRGHLGSQFERKAETNLRLDKDGEATVVWSEKNRRAPITKDRGPRFAWSEEHQMHVSIESALAAKLESERSLYRADAESVFQESGKSALRHGEFTTLLGEICGLKESGARRRMEKMRVACVIQKQALGFWSLTP